MPSYKALLLSIAKSFFFFFLRFVLHKISILCFIIEIPTCTPERHTSKAGLCFCDVADEDKQQISIQALNMVFSAVSVYNYRQNN